MNISNSELLKQFAKKLDVSTNRDTGICVIYTRVSSKEQAEENTSLDSQKRYCEEYAQRRNMSIDAYFGGTYESAKQDERKEFKKMLEYVNRNKKVDTILVYSYDRFSRSGSNATYLSEQLQNKGVKILAVSQDIDVSSSSGRFQRNMILMFSQFDNEQRKDKSVKGMIENLRQGYWISATPFGYINLCKKGKARTHRYEITEQGKLLKKGFELKAQGKLNNLEIVAHLNRLGCKVNYKSFVRILSNPFYCGYVVHKSIAGEIYPGKHPALVSETLFFRANNIVNENPHKGISKSYKINELALKGFAKDETSLSPFTGYIQKGIYYYKTRDNGTCVNVNANYLNCLFAEVLKGFEFDTRFRDDLAFAIKNEINVQLVSQIQEAEQLKKQLNLIKGKKEKLEERFIEGEVDKPLFEKFRLKYKEEAAEIEMKLGTSTFSSSNIEKVINKGLEIAGNVSEIWCSSDYDNKVKLQYLLFPEGILYNKKNNTVRTPKVNTFFSYIAQLARPPLKNEKAHLLTGGLNSHRVASPGIEPGSGASETLILSIVLRGQ